MLGGMADTIILKMKECRHGNQWKAATLLVEAEEA